MKNIRSTWDFSRTSFLGTLTHGEYVKKGRLNNNMADNSKQQQMWDNAYEFTKAALADAERRKKESSAKDKNNGDKKSK